MKESQKYILPHSQAKLDLYQKYLEKYFSILGLAKGISKVNIYDFFSGTGIYEDGREGSPILAFNKIKENRALFERNGWAQKPIAIFINDDDKNKICKVEEYLTNANNPKICSIRFESKNIIKLIPEIINEINDQNFRERNLIFIDPYGYKNIDPVQINNLLRNERTEILMFLPVSFMHRFKNKSLTDESNCYQALNDFVTKLFPENHQMLKNESLHIEEFINYIKEGFSFNGEFYSVSHSIERSKGSLFAVFFITSHIYGLERMLTVKWAEDKDFGEGHRIKSAQTNLFEEEIKEEIESQNYEWLARNLHDFIEAKGKISNLELYEFTLKNSFLPKHSNRVLNDWKKEECIIVTDASSNQVILKPKTFCNKWDDYKTKKPKIYIKLKSENGTIKY